VTIEEVDNSPLHDLTAFDDDCDGTSFSGIHVVSHLDDRAPFSSAYTPTAAVFHMDDMDSDDDWTVEPFDIICMDLTTTFQSTTFQPSICQQLEPYFDHDFDCDLNVFSVRAFHFAGDPVDIILDSGADASVLPMSYAHVGTSVLSQQESSYVDAQGAPIKIHDIRLAEITMGGVRFKEKFLIGNVTTPLLSLGRFFRAGWSICNDGSFCLVKGSEKIDIGFRCNSLVAKGFIRVISDASTTGSNTSTTGLNFSTTGLNVSATGLNPQVSKDATSCERPDNRQVSGSDGDQQDVNVLRAVILTERLQNVGRRWEQIGPELWAMLSYGGRFVDTTLIPADQLMWRRTTLLKVNGSWELVELSEQISTMEDRCKWFDTDVQAEASLTLGHTNVMSPEALGFRLEALHAVPSEPARGSGDFGLADAAEAAAPADARAELPPEERVVPLETFVDGVLLNETSSLRALRAACSFLGLSQTGNKAQCLKRILRHVRERELIDAEAVGQRLQVEAERTPEQQRVSPEPSQAEKDIHDLVHIPYKDWCPLCVSFKARQDRHPSRDHATSFNSVVSFDFGYASRGGDQDKLTVLFAHDRFTGAMIGIPTPAKGGKYMPYLGTELARFVVSTGHNPMTLRCDNEPSTLALLDTVSKALRAVSVNTNVETSAPHDHQANGAAEVTVQVIRQQAALLLRQLEIGGGSEEFLFG